MISQLPTYGLIFGLVEDIWEYTSYLKNGKIQYHNAVQFVRKPSPVFLDMIIYLVHSRWPTWHIQF